MLFRYRRWTVGYTLVTTLYGVDGLLSLDV